MEITEVRLKVVDNSDRRLLAFCSITLDDAFVVRDLKVIDGANGPFIAMPARKATYNCAKCGGKNQLRANFCSHCGTPLDESQQLANSTPDKMYAEIAHPINQACRDMIQKRVLLEYDREKQMTGQGTDAHPVTFATAPNLSRTVTHSG